MVYRSKRRSSAHDTDWPLKNAVTWLQLVGVLLHLVEVAAVVMIAGSAFALSRQLRNSQEMIVHAIEGLRQQAVQQHETEVQQLQILEKKQP